MVAVAVVGIPMDSLVAVAVVEAVLAQQVV
jgi:hypothetical protein